MRTAGQRFLDHSTPLFTVILAFVIGGLVVLLAGANPFGVYKDLWVGAGFDWPFQYLPGNPFGVDGTLSEINIISTLVTFTPLVLTGLAVAFAFRCGLFNIGGQGQFWAGAVAGLLTAHALGGVAGMALGTLAGAAAGGAWAAVPGALKAFRGAHEVVSTIMLNWIAIYMTSYLFGLGGPLQDASTGSPTSDTVPDSATYPGVWGVIQPVHIGIFIALGAAVLFWVILNRTTLGYEVRAVGYNPEAARYGGISVSRSIILAMAIAGAFAGLAGVGDVLGRSHQIVTTNLAGDSTGFTGIAVALLGRNTPVGVVLSALLFASLSSGARLLSGSFSPELASALATIIQGVIILLVGGEAIVRWLMFRSKPGGGLPEPDAEVTLPDAATGAV
jgi:simple sugar transport system permease protein